MTTQPERAPLDGGDLAKVNGALSLSVQLTIESQTHPDPKCRRDIDFAGLDRATAAARRLLAAQGETPLPAAGGWRGMAPVALLEAVQAVAALAAPYRPKERRA